MLLASKNFLFHAFAIVTQVLKFQAIQVATSTNCCLTTASVVQPGLFALSLTFFLSQTQL